MHFTHDRSASVNDDFNDNRDRKLVRGSTTPLIFTPGESPAGSMRKKLQWELTFQVLYVEVFKFPLDLAEQVHQVAPQRQRKLGVLQGSKREVAVTAHHPSKLQIQMGLLITSCLWLLPLS